MRLSEDGPDETEGRRLYRARADAFARAQIAMAARRVSFGADGRSKMESTRAGTNIEDGLAGTNNGDNVIRCKRTGEGLAVKVGGGHCVCRSGDDCVLEPRHRTPRLPEPFRGVALEQLVRIGGAAWAEAHIDLPGMVDAFERLAFAFFRDTTTAFLERYGTNDDPKGAL